jgi:hypothetical protein
MSKPERASLDVVAESGTEVIADIAESRSAPGIKNCTAAVPVSSRIRQKLLRA